MRRVSPPNVDEIGGADQRGDLLRYGRIEDEAEDHSRTPELHPVDRLEGLPVRFGVVARGRDEQGLRPRLAGAAHDLAVDRERLLR